MKTHGKPIKNTGHVEVERLMKHFYPRVTILWDGNDPTLVIPDDLISQKDAIVEMAEKIWLLKHGKVEFEKGK